MKRGPIVTTASLTLTASLALTPTAALADGFRGGAVGGHVVSRPAVVRPFVARPFVHRPFVHRPFVHRPFFRPFIPFGVIGAPVVVYAPPPVYYGAPPAYSDSAASYDPPAVYAARGTVAVAPPPAQSGHSSGSHVFAWMVASATRFIGNRAAPRERSISEPTPTTPPPAFSTHATTSRVEPPVVMTSSTTRQRSPGVSVKPRRSAIASFSRSVKSARAPSARATSWATRMPPIAGASTVVAPVLRKGAARAAPSAAACSGCWRTSADWR